MRIAVLGSGGLGAYFGGRLAAAGPEVTLIARGAQLAALRERGLRIESPLGNLHLARVNATDDTAAVGPVDFVLFAVKLYDSADAIKMLTPLLGPTTLVVPFQNGVDSVETLTRAVGRQHVAGGTAYITSAVSKPGVVRHTAMNRLIFGPQEANQLARLQALFDACKKAGIDALVSDRITVEIWSKFARLTVFSGMTAVTRGPIGPLRADPDLFTMTKGALKESIAVARGRQIPLPHNLYDEIVTAWTELPPNARSSMLEDLERGRRLELPWLSGAIVRIGREVGVDTPIHQFITTVLKPHVNGSQPAEARRS